MTANAQRPHTTATLTIKCLLLAFIKGLYSNFVLKRQSSLYVVTFLLSICAGSLAVIMTLLTYSLKDSHSISPR